MLTKLIDISTCTPIAQLPDVINANNLAITEEIDNLYDKTKNVLTKSVYAPVGSVKAYNAEFTTLTLDHLIIRDPNALLDVVKSTLKVSEHNLLKDRYSTDDIAQNMSINTNNNNFHFCHDASTIVLPNFSNVIKNIINIDSYYVTVYNVLEKIVKEIGILKLRLSNNAEQAIRPGELISSNDSMLNQSEQLTVSLLSSRMKVQHNLVDKNKQSISSNIITYPETYLSSSVAQLRRLNVPKLHINDLVSGKRFTYITLTENRITLTNDLTNVLECSADKAVLTISLKITDPGNQKFKILLDRETNKYLTLDTNRPELTRLQLICTYPYDAINGTKWDLYNYSLPSNSSKIDIITED